VAKVFEIDVASLGDAAFAAETGLRSLLEGDTTKLFWDVRADSAALFHQFGMRVDPESVIDLQLLATIQAITRGETMTNLPSLGGMFDAASSVLTFSEKLHMEHVREQAQKRCLPRFGGSFEAWMARPLSPVLLEYAADVRFFGRLHASLTQFEKQYSLPLKAAVQNRIAEAQSTTYSNEDHGSVVSADFWNGIIDSAPDSLKQRLTSARAATERLKQLPLNQRIKQRGMVKSTMREALDLLSGRRSDAAVSNASLWDACHHVAAHDRWFDNTEWKAFMSAAASSALLTPKQRSTTMRWLAAGGIPHPDSDDDYGGYSDSD
jgi:hypothetical protein